MGTVAPATASISSSYGDAALEITRTSVGQKAIADAYQRFTASAKRNAASLESAAEYAAYTNVPGDDPHAIWVLPADSPLPTVTREGMSLNIVDPPEPADDVEPAARAGDPPYVVDQTARCNARYHPIAALGWLDRCGQWSYLANSPTPDSIHRSYRNWATCYTPQVVWLMGCNLSGYLSKGIAYWQDWAPRSDSTGACRSIDLSLSVGPVGVGGSYTACEQNKITKGEQPATFASSWKGLVNGQSREVQYRVSIVQPRTPGDGVVMQPMRSIDQVIIH
jgi:hypothetical protein